MRTQRHYHVQDQGIYVYLDHSTIEVSACTAPIWVSVTQRGPIDSMYMRDKAARVLNRARQAGFVVRRLDGI